MGASALAAAQCFRGESRLGRECGDGGTLTLNGGASATYAVAGGELTIGDNTPNQVSLTLASGTLNVGTFTSVGRGNGTSGYASGFVLRRPMTLSPALN